MPKVVDDRVRALMGSSAFRASYEKRAKAAPVFKEKFETVQSFAWATAFNERKKKAAAAGEKIDDLVRLTAGIVEVDPHVSSLFTSPRVKKLLDKGSAAHLNSALVITELTQLETPSSHKGPWQFILSADNAEETWAELLNTPVHWTPFMAGHFDAVPMVVGTVIDVAIDRSREFPTVLAAIQLWDKDWPEISELVREMIDQLGASWELSFDFSTAEERPEGTYVSEFHPTGMAILRHSKAAYPEMRVLAASADLDDTDFETDETFDGTGSGNQDPSATDSSGNGGQGNPDDLSQRDSGKDGKAQAGQKGTRKSTPSRGWKGASAMELSKAMQAQLAQCPDEETRASLLRVLEMQAEEFKADAENSEAIAQRDKEIGELTAQRDDATSKVTTLEAEKAETEKLQKIEAAKAEVDKKFSDLVAKKVYTEEDREKIVPILAKGLATGSVSMDDAEILASLKLNGEQDPLPGETPPGSSGTANIDDEEQDKLRDEAVKDLEAKGVIRRKEDK